MERGGDLPIPHRVAGRVGRKADGGMCGFAWERHGLLGGPSSRLGPARLSADLSPEEVCMAATALLQAPAPTCSCCNGAALSSVHSTLALCAYAVQLLLCCTTPLACLQSQSETDRCQA